MKITYPRVEMKIRDLKLADVVDISSVYKRGWGTAIVKQIANGNVTLFRPYGTNADFTYTGGVICYVGIEEFTVSLDSDITFLVYSREELR